MKDPTYLIKISTITLSLWLLFGTVWTTLAIKYPPKYDCTPSKENQEAISQLSGLNERLDTLEQWQEYLIKFLNDMN